MSEDEALVFMGSVGVALFLWGRWYYRTLAVHGLVSRQSSRLALYITPIVCIVLLLAVLRLFASHDVRDSAMYLGLYTALGAAWVGLCLTALVALGVRAHEDIAERRNRAASVVVEGAMLGLTLAYAGGNIGDGPGWWVVVFAAGLATAAWFAAWWLVATLSAVTDWITIDRDMASGIRLAGFVTASGLVLGRAVAGDWVSVGATIVDFGQVAWFVLPLAGMATVLDRTFALTPERPEGPMLAGGVVPACAYVGLSIVYVLALGAWQ